MSEPVDRNPLKLPPYSGGRPCPKCGVYVPDQRKWKALAREAVEATPVEFRDCLERVCACGYVWEELPLDRMPPPPTPEVRAQRRGWLSIIFGALLVAGCGTNPRMQRHRVVCYSGGVVVFDEMLTMKYTGPAMSWQYVADDGAIVELPADCTHRYPVETK